MDSDKINEVLIKLNECEKELYELNTTMSWNNNCNLDECIRKISGAKALLNTIK